MSIEGLLAGYVVVLLAALSGLALYYNQRQKRFKNLRRQKQGLSLAQQDLLVGIKGELSKPIKMVDEQRHDFLVTSYELPHRFFGTHQLVVR